MKEVATRCAKKLITDFKSLLTFLSYYSHLIKKRERAKDFRFWYYRIFVFI